MRHPAQILVLAALLSCSPEQKQDNPSAPQTSVEEQFRQKYPMHSVDGLTALVGPAPFGDETSVAQNAIQASEHPCGKVRKAVRNEVDGSVTVRCSNGERFNIITIETIADPVVMRCSAIEELIHKKLETCHSL